MAAWAANYSLTEDILQEDEAAMRKVESQLKANRANLESLSRNYETTIFVAKDRENFEAFKSLRGPYLRAQEEVLKLNSDKKNNEARTMLHSRLDPEFE